MKQSPAFSSFRHLMDIYDNFLEQEEKTKIAKKFIEKNNLVLFFKFDNEYFAAPEESRIIFSLMKKPDQETSLDWAKNADFFGFNLKDLVESKKTKKTFKYEDLDKIVVIDNDKVDQLMEKL